MFSGLRGLGSHQTMELSHILRAQWPARVSGLRKLPYWVRPKKIVWIIRLLEHYKSCVLESWDAYIYKRKKAESITIFSSFVLTNKKVCTDGSSMLFYVVNWTNLRFITISFLTISSTWKQIKTAFDISMISFLL